MERKARKTITKVIALLCVVCMLPITFVSAAEPTVTVTTAKIGDVTLGTTAAEAPEIDIDVAKSANIVLDGEVDQGGIEVTYEVSAEGTGDPIIAIGQTTSDAVDGSFSFTALPATTIAESTTYVAKIGAAGLNTPTLRYFKTSGEKERTVTVVPDPKRAEFGFTQEITLSPNKAGDTELSKVNYQKFAENAQGLIDSVKLVDVPGSDADGGYRQYDKRYGGNSDLQYQEKEGTFEIDTDGNGEKEQVNGYVLDRSYEMNTGVSMFTDRTQYRFAHVGDMLKDANFLLVSSNEADNRVQTNSSFNAEQKAAYQAWITGDNTYLTFTANDSGTVYVASEFELTNFGDWNYFKMDMTMPEGYANLAAYDPTENDANAPYYLARVQYDEHKTEYHGYSHIYYKTFAADKPVEVPTLGQNYKNNTGFYQILLKWTDHISADTSLTSVTYDTDKQVPMTDGVPADRVKLDADKDITITAQAADPAAVVEVEPSTISAGSYGEEGVDVKITVTAPAGNSRVYTVTFATEGNNGNLITNFKRQDGNPKTLENITTDYRGKIYGSNGYIEPEKAKVVVNDGGYGLQANAEVGFLGTMNRTDKGALSFIAEPILGATIIRVQQGEYAGDFKKVDINGDGTAGKDDDGQDENWYTSDSTTRPYGGGPFSGENGEPGWMSFTVSDDCTVYMVDNWAYYKDGGTTWPNKPDDWYTSYSNEFAFGYNKPVHYKHYKAGETVVIPNYGVDPEWPKFDPEPLQGNTYNDANGLTGLMGSRSAVVFFDPNLYAVQWDNQADTISHDASIRGITVNGESVPNFNTGTKEYTVYCEAGLAESIIDINKSNTAQNISIEGLEDGAYGTATITITAEDKTTTNTYTVNIVPNRENVTLSSITYTYTVDGVPTEKTYTAAGTEQPGTPIEISFADETGLVGNPQIKSVATSDGLGGDAVMPTDIESNGKRYAKFSIGTDEYKVHFAVNEFTAFDYHGSSYGQYKNKYTFDVIHRSSIASVADYTADNPTWVYNDYVHIKPTDTTDWNNQSWAIMKYDPEDEASTDKENNADQLFENGLQIQISKSEAAGGTATKDQPFFSNTQYNGQNDSYWMTFTPSSAGTIYMSATQLSKSAGATVDGDGGWPNKPDDWTAVSDNFLNAGRGMRYYKHFEAGETVKVPNYGYDPAWEATTEAASARLTTDPVSYSIVWDSDIQTVSASIDQSKIGVSAPSQLTASSSTGDNSFNWYLTRESTEYASIDKATGVITPTKVGTVTVIASAIDGSVWTEKDIEIAETVVEKTITIADAADSIVGADKTLQLSATIANAEEGDAVVWSIAEGEGVATVSDAGLVTAVSDGTVVVKAALNTNPSVYALKTITVTTSAPSTVALSVTASGGGTVTDITAGEPGVDWGASKSESYAQGTALTLKAVPGAGRFLYWQDGDSTRVVSTEEAYSFTLGTDTSLVAVFTSAEETYQITFRDRNKAILAEGDTSQSEVVVPANPTAMGYEFRAWVKDDEVLTIKAGDKIDLQAIISEGKDALYEAGYVKLQTEYTVTLEGADLETGKYQYNDKITVHPAEAPAGQKFAYWTKDDEIVSYRTEYSFYVGAQDTTVKAVFVPESQVVEPKPIIIMSTPTVVNTNQISFLAERDLPTGYTLAETGIIVSSAEGDFNLSTPGILISKSISKDNVGQYTVRKGNVDPGATWYARAYMIYSDGTNTVTVYSGIVSGTRPAQ